MDVLLFEIHGRRCALPIVAVREVFTVASVTPLPMAPASVRGLTALHGQVLPLLDLGGWLPAAGASIAVPRAGEEAVAFEGILDEEGAPVRAALAVDRILHLGSVEPPAGAAPGTPAFVSGQVAEAGGPALLVDASAVLHEVRHAVLAAARGAA